MKSRARFLFTVGFLAALASLPSCGKHQVEVGLNADLSRQVTEAIGAINTFNQVADRTPENLRAAAYKVVDKLKIEGGDFLAHDARYFTDHTLATAGIIASGQVEHVDRKMKAYMVALKGGLEEALPKIKAEKSRDKAIELLRNLKINVKPLDPFVYLVNPNKFIVNFLLTHTGTIKDVEFKSPRTVELTGFGLLRPADEPTEYRIEIIGAKEESRLLSAKSVVTQSGPFLLQLNLSNFTPVKGDHKMMVYWGKIKLTEIHFETNELKAAPPVEFVEEIKEHDLVKNYPPNFVFPPFVPKLDVYKEEWECPEGYKIFEVTYKCIPTPVANNPRGTCAWSTGRGKPGVDPFAADFEIINDGRKVIVYRHVSIENLTIHHKIKYKRLIAK